MSARSLGQVAPATSAPSAGIPPCPRSTSDSLGASPFQTPAIRRSLSGFLNPSAAETPAVSTAHTPVFPPTICWGETPKTSAGVTPALASKKGPDCRGLGGTAIQKNEE